MRNRLLAAAVLALFAALPAMAQMSMPPGDTTPFRDTSMLKPPAGAKVAILEFEDLECPGCAAAYPTVKAALDHYKIPYVRYDFLIPSHIWSADAAVTARYLQDKVSPEQAEEFRGDVFKMQPTINSKDDLANYTRKWFQQHGLQMPFVIDPTGLFRKEVELDCDLGNRLNLQQTPTIVVVSTAGWIHVTDTKQLYAAIDRAEAMAAAAPAAKTTAHNNVRKSTLPAK